jgi:hypothetical protein
MTKKRVKERLVKSQFNYGETYPFPNGFPTVSTKMPETRPRVKILDPSRYKKEISERKDKFYRFHFNGYLEYCSLSP